MEAHWHAEREIGDPNDNLWSVFCTKHGKFSNLVGRCLQCDEEAMLAGYPDITITEDE
jgi:hypothetical protein